MDLSNLLNLPFLTRKMLQFEHGAKLSLQITSRSNTAGTIVIRGLTREGVFAFKHTVAADNTAHSESFRVPDIPIMVSIIDSENAFNQGQAFASLELQANDDTLYNLCTGFVYQNKAVSYPQSSSQDIIPNRGVVRIVQSNVPALGAGFVFDVPEGRVWHILALTFQLTTSSTVSNRRVHVSFSDGNDFGIQAFSSQDQPASLGYNYYFAHYGSVPDELDNSAVLATLPQNLYIPALGEINAPVVNFQTNDQLSQANMLIEDFFAFT